MLRHVLVIGKDRKIMIFAILVLLGGTLFIRLMIAIFRNVCNKVRSVVGLAFAVVMALWALSVLDKISNNQMGDADPFFCLLIVPLMFGIGIGFIFVTINFYDDGDNWMEYFSIGSVSFGKDISVGIIIPLIAVIVIATILNLIIMGFWAYVPFILYGIVQLYFSIRVFITSDN